MNGDLLLWVQIELHIEHVRPCADAHLLDVSSGFRRTLQRDLLFGGSISAKNVRRSASGEVVCISGIDAAPKDRGSIASDVLFNDIGTGAAHEIRCGAFRLNCTLHDSLFVVREARLIDRAQREIRCVGRPGDASYRLLLVGGKRIPKELSSGAFCKSFAVAVGVPVTPQGTRSTRAKDGAPSAALKIVLKPIDFAAHEPNATLSLEVLAQSTISFCRSVRIISRPVHDAKFTTSRPAR
ncbi:hypothetical protein [Rhizobium leguminosarum]|uniref:hypothetical protein n=1 Tax=Rhizobium leguminosarum TaxID=384 RepID=UPI0013BA2506|nr:hypothetical protein [Rhizobium leguminosarum]NEH74031.1 hypothetical protein [Rhizobium leguminosarum]